MLWNVWSMEIRLIYVTFLKYFPLQYGISTVLKTSFRALVFGVHYYICFHLYLSLSLSVLLFNILRVYFVDILLINYSSLSSYMRLPICIFFFFVSATTPVLFSFLIPAILSVCSFVLLKICILCCYNCSVMTHY